METAQPKVPRAAHRAVKREAKRRGAIEVAFYGQVILAGLRAMKKEKTREA